MNQNQFKKNNYIYVKLKKYSLLSFSALTFLRFYIESPSISTFIALAMVIYGITLLYYSIINDTKKSLSTYILFGFLLSAVLTIVFGPNKFFSSIPQLLAYAGFATAIPGINLKPKAQEINYYFYCSIFILYIITGKDPEQVFSVSRNYISIILILNISFYYIACQQKNISPNIIAPLIGLAIALWASGRAGIISLLLITIYTILNLSIRKPNKSILFTIIIIASVLLIQQVTNLSVENILTTTESNPFLSGIERFERLGVKDVREEINSAYLEQLSNNPSNIIFGTKLDSIPIINSLNGNPHNSFIWLHSNYGILGVVLTALTITTTIISLLKSKNYIIILLLIVSLFRAIFDVAAFYGPLDIIIFYSVMLQFRLKKMYMKNRFYT